MSHQIVFFTTTFITLFLYLRTVAPSIAGGDSGELVAEGCQLGTSHPPGYPLYTIIAFVVTKIGQFIFKKNNVAPALLMNMTSCVFGSISSGLLSSSILYLIRLYGQYDDEKVVGCAKHNVKNNKSVTGVKSTVKKLRDTEKKQDSLFYNYKLWLETTCSVTVGVAHSCSPLAWQYSITAEVFALHNLFVTLIIHTTIRYAIYATDGLLYLGAFLCGLALTNQHTSILLEIPIIIWILYKLVLVTPPTTLTEKLLKASILFLSTLVLLYSTLPLFSITFEHAGSWGHVTTFKGFWNHLTRKDYGSFRLYSGDDEGSENVFTRVWLWLIDYVFVQSNLLFGLCTFFGIGSLLRHDNNVLLLSNRSGANDISLRNVSFERSKKKGRKNSSGADRNGDSFSFVEESNKFHSSRGLGSILFLCLLFYQLVFHSLANLPLQNRLLFGIHQRFWMQPNILCFLFAGFGLNRFISIFIRYISKSEQSLTQQKIHNLTLLTISSLLLLVSIMCASGLQKNDQSDNVYFRSYATSILSTLPQDALLFINYDQQWTSVRYMQECEGFRKDVTSIHVSMMSYAWWEHKQKLYPQIIFPGTHYQPNVNKAFSFSQLLDSNYDSFQGRIFLGGHLTFPESNYMNRYDEIPHGIVSRIIRKNNNNNEQHSPKNNMNIEQSLLQDAETYRKYSEKIWKKVIKAFEHQGLPNTTRYDEYTWEWTIQREFFDHWIARGTHLLDLAVNKQRNDDNNEESKKLDLVVDKRSSSFTSLVDACAWLEIARLNDEMASKSPATWKNLGLGYMGIVRSKEDELSTTLPIVVSNIVSNSSVSFLLNDDFYDIWYVNMNESRDDSSEKRGWKGWASSRWSNVWSHYLEMDGAKLDPAYLNIKTMYEKVMSSVSSNGKKKNKMI